MKRTKHELRARPLALALVVALAVSLLATAGRPDLAPGDAPSEAESLFNGRDLTGWNGDPLFWSVEDGAIVGRTTEANPAYVNTFLIWAGGALEDFTLTLDFKLTNHNSGIQYRSKVLEGWRLAGYQADIDEANRYTGMLYEEQGRGFIARRGQQVVVEPDGTPREVGSVGDPDELATHIKAGDWNRFEVVAKGNHLVHKVNGHVTAEATDNDVEGRALSGLLGLQIHTGPPMEVAFKNIMLTRH